MSTFYAVIEEFDEALRLAEELVLSGVRVDDISILSKEVLDTPESTTTSSENQPGTDLADKMTVEVALISGIDTSDSSTDVETVDQADESQALAEDALYPRGEISQAEHERDDLELAVSTGFPTQVPAIDDFARSESVERLEAMFIPAVGSVVGGGALATAAIGFDDAEAAIYRHLVDEGMNDERAKVYASAYGDQMTLLAVLVSPGDVDESLLEQAVDRYRVRETDLVDVPRFYDGQGQVSMR